MKNAHTFLILIFSVIITAQNSSLKITPKYKHLKLLGKWTFETMQTTTHAEEKEVSIINKDLENVETLSFNKSGELIYNVITDGIKKKGNGTWYVKEERIRIIADSNTIDGTYQINDEFLTISTSEEETEEYYGYSIVIKYRAK